MIKNKLSIDSLLKSIDENISRAINTMSSCTKTLEKIKNNSESIEESIIVKNNISNSEIISIILANCLTKKIEKIFWHRFFQFKNTDIILIKNKHLLSNDRILKILLKVWNLKLASEKINSLEVLDTLLSPPDFVKKWATLGNEQELTILSNELGLSIIENTSNQNTNFSRSSDFSLYLLVNYLFNHIKKEKFEQLINQINIDKDFINIFPNILDSKIGQSKESFLFIASILKAIKFENKNEFKNLYRILLTTKNISSFGDPRAYPLSLHWDRIRQLEPEGFEDWKKSFNEEDIVFFFSELNKVKNDRKDFWLKYKRTAEKIVLIIDHPTIKHLNEKYSNDIKTSEIIKRAYIFNTSISSRAKQFLILLFFKEFVIIEGSDTGFGCQVFKIEDFNKQFGDSFHINRNSNIIREKSFEKFRGISSGRLESKSHIGNWEATFTFDLQQYGILKDR